MRVKYCLLKVATFGRYYSNIKEVLESLTPPRPNRVKYFRCFSVFRSLYDLSILLVGLNLVN